MQTPYYVRALYSRVAARAGRAAVEGAASHTQAGARAHAQQAALRAVLHAAAFELHAAGADGGARLHAACVDIKKALNNKESS